MVLGPFLTTQKNSLKTTVITSQCLGYRPVEYAVKGTDIECTTIECILPWVMRNWAGCKKFGVVGYTSGDIDLVCTTTGYTRPTSQLLGASSDMDLVYTATGYTSNDTDLGCKTIGNTEFTALGTG